MGISLNRVTTLDKQLVETVYDLFDDITEDGTPISVVSSYIDLHSDAWLKLADDDGLIGFVQLKPYNRSMLEIHPFIVKHRRNISERSIRIVLDYFDTELTNYSSLITNIPACKRYATLFAIKMGFKEVGRYAKGFNNAHDMVLFQRMRFKHGRFSR